MIWEMPMVRADMIGGNLGFGWWNFITCLERIFWKYDFEEKLIEDMKCDIVLKYEILLNLP